MQETPAFGVPDIRQVDYSILRTALSRGWSDFRRAPAFGLFFGAAAVAGGLLMWWITRITGQTYWLIFAAIGFPLAGPFVAVGLYDVSRRLEAGVPLDWGAVLGVIARQRSRQLPMISAIVIILFLFWFFLAHMIFALFMGLSTMTNVSSSFEVYLTANGLAMLAFGSAVGAALAFLTFAITVISLPLLLDREVDFVTAMITSVKLVTQNMGVMLAWGAIIAVLSFLAMLPVFLGLLVVLPLLGHASWHLYRLVSAEEDAA